MQKNKKYPTISSREIQRNFSVLKDALAEHGAVYISYYNKRLAKVTAEPEVKKEKKEKDFEEILEELHETFKERRKEIAGKSYDEVYREELMKKYG